MADAVDTRNNVKALSTSAVALSLSTVVATRGIWLKAPAANAAAFAIGFANTVTYAGDGTAGIPLDAGETYFISVQEFINRGLPPIASNLWGISASVTPSVYWNVI